MVEADTNSLSVELGTLFMRCASSGVLTPRSQEGGRPTLSLHFHAVIWVRLDDIRQEGAARLNEGQSDGSEFTAKEYIADTRDPWNALSGQLGRAFCRR